MDFVELNNGVKMPQEGFGVFQVPDGQMTEQAAADALAATGLSTRLLPTETKKL